MVGLTCEVVFDYSSRNANSSLLWSGIVTVSLENAAEAFMQFECRLITGKNGDFIGFPDRKYENVAGETKYHKVMGPTWDREGKKPTVAGDAFQTMVLKAVQEHRAKASQNGPDDEDIPF